MIICSSDQDHIIVPLNINKRMADAMLGQAQRKKSLKFLFFSNILLTFALVFG